MLRVLSTHLAAAINSRFGEHVTGGLGWNLGDLESTIAQHGDVTFERGTLVQAGIKQWVPTIPQAPTNSRKIEIITC